MCHKIKTVAKLFFCLGIFVFIPFLYADELQENVSPAALFSQIKSSYNTGFYPGVIKKGTEFQSKFPHSVLLPEVLVYKGESLYLLNEKELAKETLLQAKKSSGSLLSGKADYWLARIEADSANYLEAAHLFSSAATLLKNTDSQNIRFYYDALLKGSTCAIESGNPSSAIPPLEYLKDIIFSRQASLLFSQPDTFQVLFNLFRAYSQINMPEKIVETYATIPCDKISLNDYHVISFYAADSYVQLKDFASAYEIYSDLVKNASSDIAVNALKSAWNIVKNIPHKNMDGLLSEAEKRLEENPLLIADFRTRLGIDFFEKGSLLNAEKSFEISQEILRQQKQDISEDVNKLYVVNLCYLTEIDFLQGNADKESAETAYKKLSDFIEKTEDESKIDSDKTLYAQIARYGALSKNWERAIFYGTKGLPLTESGYWLALALFHSEQKNECIEILEKYVYAQENPKLPENLVMPATLLYADVLFQSGKYEKAMILFNSLEEKSLLDSSGLLDYAVSAIRLGKNQQAKKIASKSVHAETDYVLSLVAYNQQDWETLEAKTKAYLSEKDGKNKIYAEYLYGFALFRQNKFEKAYDAFVQFAEKGQSQKLVRDTQKNALVCALQLHQQTEKKASDWLNKAIFLAEKLVKTAPNFQEKEESVLVLAKIYTDAGLFDSGIKVLSPYLKRNDIYGIKCRFYAAEILLNKKDYEGSDKFFAEVEKNPLDKNLAEQSSYRRAEVFYLANQFEVASERFVAYRKKYPNGIYADSALYFNGDSLKRLNKIDNAILCYESLIQQFPKSTFRFSAMSELVLLYKEKNEYETALKIAKQLMKENRQQAILTEIDSQILELESLTLDMNQKISETELKYQKAGETKTAEGRALSVKLAELYFSTNNAEKAVHILSQTINMADDSKEIEVSANANYLVAKWHAESGDFKKAAPLFLDSAGLFVLFDLDLAARAMYYSAESFAASSMPMDAKSVADQMVVLFPNNEWTQAASKWR